MIYGIGTDDMHKLASYPGKSWVMVRASELSGKAILGALETGDFYVSTGIELADIREDAASIRLEIKTAGDERFTTQFIARGGRVVKTDFSTTPGYLISGDEGYIRVKIIDSNGRLAFTQPIVISPVANREE